MSKAAAAKPVLVLGAGINGAAVARELVLNGIPVFVVDQSDIAAGATAKSSRLIHGGLRYLEYGDVGLVAESLAERERLLQLAPQFVRPLKLHIPVLHRFGGLVQAAFRFLHVSRLGGGRFLANWRHQNSQRGLVAVRIGLWLYDRLARSSVLPGHSVKRVGAAGTPSVDSAKYRWICSYYDAQMLFPERFVLALLEDARQVAEQTGIEFHVLPYCAVTMEQGSVKIRPVSGCGLCGEFQPAAIVNATGAWGDLTLEHLQVPSEQLLGGTKGSHFITSHAGLKGVLGDGGVYAEAADGRLVFILPFVDTVLVGTTDERFQGPPDQAVASDDEVQYLVGMVNEVFPQMQLTINDVLLHYSGVRPLPYVPTGRTGAIPRGHWRHSAVKDGIPVETLIGGKLTTCRAFGEEVTDFLLEQLAVRRTAHTRDRPVPGAIDFPADSRKWCHAVAAELKFQPAQVETVFRLVGTRTQDILSQAAHPHDCHNLPGTDLPIAFVDWVIQHEWVQTLCDLVERRLGLVFDARLSLQSLEVLADRMSRAGLLSSESLPQEMERCRRTLQERYGRTLPVTDGESFDVRHASTM